MATQMIDISLATDEDLLILSGDFSAIESTGQHQRQLILNNKGDFKQNPTICVGAFEYLDDENFRELIRAISKEFMRDGMEVKGIDVTKNGSISTDAFYP
jgi:proteasome assembly chaperone (PAC2) family protein